MDSVPHPSMFFEDNLKRAARSSAKILPTFPQLYNIVSVHFGGVMATAEC